MSTYVVGGFEYMATPHTWANEFSELYADDVKNIWPGIPSADVAINNAYLQQTMDGHSAEEIIVGLVESSLTQAGAPLAPLHSTDGHMVSSAILATPFIRQDQLHSKFDPATDDTLTTMSHCVPGTSVASGNQPEPNAPQHRERQHPPIMSEDDFHAALVEHHGERRGSGFPHEDATTQRRWVDRIIRAFRVCREAAGEGEAKTYPERQQEIVAWELLLATRDAQECGGILRDWGSSNKKKYETYPSFKERMETVIECIEGCPDFAQSLFQPLWVHRAVTRPHAELKQKIVNKSGNRKKTEQIQLGRQAIPRKRTREAREPEAAAEEHPSCPTHDSQGTSRGKTRRRTRLPSLQSQTSDSSPAQTAEPPQMRDEDTVQMAPLLKYEPVPVFCHPLTRRHTYGGEEMPSVDDPTKHSHIGGDALGFPPGSDSNMLADYAHHMQISQASREVSQQDANNPQHEGGFNPPKYER